MIGQKVSLPVEKVDDAWFTQLITEPTTVTHLAIQNPDLFKKITGLKKVVNTAGYVYKTKFGNFHACYVPPQKSITLDKRVAAEARASLEALQAHHEGRYQEPGSQTDVLVHHAKSFDEWRHTLINLPIISVDIETTGLKHYESEIRTIGFGLSDVEAVVFMFDDVKADLRSFFEQYTGRIVMHKAAFDSTQLIHKLWMNSLGDTDGLVQGLFHLVAKTHCSLILSYVITNTCAGNELSLKAQTQAVYGDYGVQEPWLIPLEQLIPYNGKDCSATLWLYAKHQANLSPLEDVFERMNSFLREVVWMQLTGMPVNKKTAIKNAAILKEKQVELLTFIRAHARVAEYMVIRKEQWVVKRNAELKKKRVTVDDYNDGDFNPGSNLQLQALLYDVMGLPVISLTKNKNPSTDGDTLKDLLNHTEEKNLLKAFVELSQVEMLLSTFVPHFVNAPRVNGHHCLFGFYNIGGTQSGRLSCVAPWTRIKTQRGLVPITEIIPGDFAWTHKRRWRPISRLVLKPSEKMFDVRFSNGYTLSCTAAHKLNIPGLGWKTLQEIINEHLEEVDTESAEHHSNVGAVQIYRTDLRSSGITVGNDFAQHQFCVAHSYPRSGVESQTSSQVFDIENWREESNERQNRGRVSSLHWRLQRWLRVSHPATQWEAAVCSSNSDGGRSWSIRTTGISGCSSHRRKSSQQRLGQFSSLHKCWTSEDSLSANYECRGKITSINPRGIAPVWDITVEEDSSYWAEGVFNHNSDSPNQQNIPSTGNAYAKYIKEMVEAPEGWWFVGADFRSLEDMVMTLLTRDPNRMKVYLDGFDGHSLRAFYYFRDQMPDIEDTVESINSIGTKYKQLRQLSKPPTFAMTYAGTWSTLVKNCGFSEEMAKQIEANYHALYQESDAWTRARLDQAAIDGYVELAFGLRIFTPLIKAAVTGRARPKEAGDEERSVGNAMGQSYGLLNSRAAHAFTDRILAAGLHNDVRPAAQIHDASYYWVRKSVKLLQWVNQNLIEEMEWAELPELQHPSIKLGGNLIVYDNWSKELVIPNRATYKQIGDLVNGIQEV